MTKEEAIKMIEIAKAEIEWDYPLDYQIAFDMAIEALKLSNEPQISIDKPRGFQAQSISDITIRR